MNIITPKEVKAWVASASEEDIQNFLDDGLSDLIIELEQEDYFGTEGFEKRFA